MLTRPVPGDHKGTRDKEVPGRAGRTRQSDTNMSQASLLYVDGQSTLSTYLCDLHRCISCCCSESTVCALAFPISGVANTAVDTR